MKIGILFNVYTKIGRDFSFIGNRFASAGITPSVCCILVPMLLTLAHIGPKNPKSGDKAHYDALTRLYLDRIAPYYPIQPEAFPTEAAFLAWLQKSRSRTPILPILLDSRGRQLSSTEFAHWLGARRDQGAQHLVLAIGPPDGWSPPAREAAGLLLSFGPITLPHELARLVLAEQLYRACTILAGHPYHSGH